MGLIDMAVNEYKMAITIDPDHARSHYNIGVAYDKKGLINEAVVHYKKAISAKPDYPKALSNLAGIYAKIGRIEEAIGLFERAMNIDPDDPITLFNLALTYEESAKRREQRAESVEQRSKELRVKAVRTYEKVLVLDPDNVRARERMTRLMSKR